MASIFFEWDGFLLLGYFEKLMRALTWIMPERPCFQRYHQFVRMAKTSKLEREALHGYSMARTVSKIFHSNLFPRLIRKKLCLIPSAVHRILVCCLFSCPQSRCIIEEYLLRIAVESSFLVCVILNGSAQYFIWPTELSQVEN